MNRSTPAAVIEQGTLPRQRSVRAPLSEIAKVATISGIQSPAIFVIGQVVAHAEVLDSSRRGLLAGARFELFAPRSALSEALQDAGAQILLAPAPLTAAARLVIGSAPLSGWIVQTIGELDTLARERATNGLSGHTTLWCANAKLAAAAREQQWSSVEEFQGGASLDTCLESLNKTEKLPF